MKSEDIQLKLEFGSLLEKIKEIIHTEIQQSMQTGKQQNGEQQHENFGFLRAKAAASAIGVSDPTFRNLVREGKIPNGYQLNDSIVVWDKAELSAAVKKLGKTAVAV